MIAGDNTEINWEDRFNGLKKKYAELRNVRIDSVKLDIVDLRKKIAEHRKIHQISINELKQQNKELSDTIADLKDAKEDIKNIKNQNQRLREEFYKYDEILDVFLRDEHFVVECIEKHKYQISNKHKGKKGFERSFTFNLENLRAHGIKDGEKYLYEPVNIPIPGEHILKASFSFSDLNEFLSTIKKEFVLQSEM